MRSTQERFREIQEYLHKRCNTDPRIIKEREEFFSRPVIAVPTRTSVKKRGEK